jgi:hypothetical protein
MRAESPLELSAALITRSLNPPYSFLLGKDSRCRGGGGKQLTEAGVSFITPYVLLRYLYTKRYFSAAECRGVRLNAHTCAAILRTSGVLIRHHQKSC